MHSSRDTELDRTRCSPPLQLTPEYPEAQRQTRLCLQWKTKPRTTAQDDVGKSSEYDSYILFDYHRLSNWLCNAWYNIDNWRSCSLSMVCTQIPSIKKCATTKLIIIIIIITTLINVGSQICIMRAILNFRWNEFNLQILGSSCQ